MQNSWNSYAVLVKMEKNAATLDTKTIWQFVMKLDIYLVLQAIPLLGTYPKEMKSYVHVKNVYSDIFVLPKTGKPKCPSTDACMAKQTGTSI